MSRRLRPNSNVELFTYRTQSLFAARKWCKFDSWFIRRARFIFTMYNGVQCLSMKINYSNLWIRFRRLKRRRTTLETPMCIYRTKFMDRPKLNISDFVDSNIDLFMYLTEGIRFGTWKVKSYIFTPGCKRCANSAFTTFAQIYSPVCTNLHRIGAEQIWSKSIFSSSDSASDNERYDCLTHTNGYEIT